MFMSVAELFAPYLRPFMFGVGTWFMIDGKAPLWAWGLLLVMVLMMGKRRCRY